MRIDKYFRIVADLYNEDNESLSIELIENGLAVSYHGGKKSKDWCK
jgi:micrococcal nuclease